MNWWCHRLIFGNIYFDIKFWQFYFFCSNMSKHCSHVPISKYIRANIVLHLFRVDIRHVLLSRSCNMGFSSFLWTKLMENCEATTSSTHSFAYHIDCSRNVLIKITKYKNFIFSLFVIRFTSNVHCSVRNKNYFTLSIKNELKLGLYFSFKQTDPKQWYKQLSIE